MVLIHLKKMEGRFFVATLKDNKEKDIKSFEIYEQALSHAESKINDNGGYVFKDEVSGWTRSMKEMSEVIYG